VSGRPSAAAWAVLVGGTVVLATGLVLVATGRPWGLLLGLLGAAVLVGRGGLDRRRRRHAPSPTPEDTEGLAQVVATSGRTAAVRELRGRRPDLSLGAAVRAVDDLAGGGPRRDR
jgi:hypothetical protein